MSDFAALQKKARLRLVQMHYESGVGHIGGNLSAIDSLLYLFHHAMKKDDRFILSKGHSAGALYIALWSVGKIKDEQLKTFHKDNTKLAGHPSPNWIEEIPFATGSLGHGLNLAAGVALGNRLQKKPGHVFCLMSDGECQEGSNWEAFIFIAHHKLNHLTILIDCNGLQGFGSTEEIASMNITKMKKLLGDLEFDVQVVKGNSEQELAAAIEKKSERPKVLLLDTRKGEGVSFMEGKMEWHYLPLNEELYNKAKQELESK